MQVDLKPCPFCGGEAKLHDDQDGSVPTVSCKRCYVQGSIYKCAGDAIGLWNRRTMPRNAETILRHVWAGTISIGEALELLEASK